MSCNSFKHMLKDCPLIHFNKEYRNIIMKYKRKEKKRNLNKRETEILRDFLKD